MNALHLNRLLEFFAGIHWVMAVFWLGLAVFTFGLAVLLYTRWGQYQPLRKCMALSILAHLILACYAATIQIIVPVPLPPEPVMQVMVCDDGTEESVGGAFPAVKADEAPWETISKDAAVADAAMQPVETLPARRELDSPAAPRRHVRFGDGQLPGDPILGKVALGGAESLAPSSDPSKAAKSPSSGAAAEKIDAPAAQRRDAAPLLPGVAVAPERPAVDAQSRPTRTLSDEVPSALLQPLPLPRMVVENDGPSGPSADDLSRAIVVKPFERIANNIAGAAAGENHSTGTGGDLAGSAAGTATSLAASGAVRGGEDAEKPLPDAYRLRTAPNRDDIARQRGATAETEAAVKAALKWLAGRQSADGRWDPRSNNGGREDKVQGHDRLGAGNQADTAVTGLTLLAFLASGETHLDGHYREEVRRGLEYLLRTQAADGNLAGEAAVYELMYSHGMAACALSEAYGMTHDTRLREPVRRALAYTIDAQDPVGGGWRYRPGDAGDTSQLGWQLMALKSGELAGFAIPEKTRQGIVRYLQSVAAGQYGGLAAYQPRERTTRSMTAEAMVCRQFLGLSLQNSTENEAVVYLLAERPGTGTYNLYYWYYATLGMYQLQGDAWQQWNEALRIEVVRRQTKEGSLAGSWDTSDLWGGYGGRLYTTALAALTIEVYCRFLPLYANVAHRKL
jgi:hypothetical protein